MEGSTSTLNPVPIGSHQLVVNHSLADDDLDVYSDIISNRAVRVVMLVLHAIVVLVALAGNGIVIYAICRQKKLRRNSTVIFILNMAFSDFVSCLIYRPLLLLELFLPFNQHFKFDYPQHHKEICQFVSYFQALFAAVGFLTMMAISQERLFLIVYPLKAKQIWTSSRVKKILAFIWIFASLSVLPMAILYTQVIAVKLDGVSVSLCGTFEGTLDSYIYFTTAFVVYFAIPMIVISVSHSKIFFALYYQPDTIVGQPDGARDRVMRVRRNLAKMMLSVSAIFALCWGPNFLYFFYLSFGGAPAKNGFFLVVWVEFLPIISSALNPFLYAINSQIFRSSIKTMCMKATITKEEGISFHNSTSSAPHLKHKSKSQKSMVSVKDFTPITNRRHGHEYEAVPTQQQVRLVGWKFASETTNNEDAKSLGGDFDVDKIIVLTDQKNLANSTNC